MLSRATCSPSAANAAVAADSNLSRLRRTSARGRLGLAVTLTANSVSKSEAAPFFLDNTEDPPFILNPEKRRLIRFEPTERKDAPHDREPDLVHYCRGSAPGRSRCPERAIPPPRPPPEPWCATSRR